MIYLEPCEETLKRFEDNSIDLIITSPPYNIGKMHSNRLQFGSYANNDMKEPDYQKWQIEVLNECYRVLSENGSVFYNHKVRIKDGKAIHPMEWLLKTDFVIKQEITWDMGKSANCDKIRFFPFSERIYWLTKNPKVKLLNKNSLSDVWRLVPTHQRKDQNHIAVMPDGIVQNILDAIPTKPNVVYDPFGGSGTTMKVCKQNGIDCIISEIDKEKENTILEKAGEKRKEKELTLMPYGSHNGIVICCKNCGSEFEETAEGYYPPIKYESDKHNRKCRRCLTELGTFS